jgi:hypothetical protein
LDTCQTIKPTVAGNIRPLARYVVVAGAAVTYQTVSASGNGKGNLVTFGVGAAGSLALLMTTSPATNQQKRRF